MKFEAALKQLAFVLPDSCKNAEIIFQKRFGGEKPLQVTVPKQPFPRHVVSTQQLSSGFWHVILDWWDGNEHYWTEQDILIN
ncbi:hypothetical protein [Runella sp.]|uniref:hypothetical protein n=1 Tax=Runella sp. TaxID=1960881 RepID=UPI003D0A4C5F